MKIDSLSDDFSAKMLVKSGAEGIFIILAIAYLFYENILVSILFIPFLYFYVKSRKKAYLEQKRKELNLQFKDGMLAVSFSLSTGYSIENAFREALQEMKMLYGEESVIVQEFKKVIYRIEINENIEKIMDDFAVKSQIDDILYFAEIFHYAKRSGGDLVSIIKDTAETIREKAEVRAEIDTIISGKRMEQRVMCVVPFGMILYLKLTSPEFIEPMYGNLTGIVIMTVSLALYCISVAIAIKIVRISV